MERYVNVLTAALTESAVKAKAKLLTSFDAVVE